ncbi:hypothetical protein [Pseudonocardia sp. H11422]|uniref:hypothetical protein n=1 Tax=Pseudonocardia sp. H11422 TaxID=2835866 RepID=UPI001BDBEFA3|nr:hypothetical protein [Pseudonocardia sp. H11422]
MRRQTLLMRFEPKATPPAGDPPGFTVTTDAATVTLLEGDGGGLPTVASYETHVTMTGKTTFVEEGTLTFDTAGDGLRLSTVGEGLLEPSAEEGALQGSVIWRAEGIGSYAGTSGLITSNFVFEPERGTASEHQVARLFLP